MTTQVCLGARTNTRSLVTALVAAAGVLGPAALAATAQEVEWVVWTSATEDDPISSISGNFSVARVFADYAGGASGLNYSAVNYWVPAVTYQHGEITAPPSSVPNTVVLGGFASHGILFRPLPGDPGFPNPVQVTDPVLAVFGLGQSGAPVDWTFNHPFEILSSGPGFFGPGSLTALPNNVLRGENGNGLIQFQGTFQLLSWTASPGEDVSGFSVGLVIPSPGVGAAAVAMAALAGGTRRRRCAAEGVPCAVSVQTGGLVASRGRGEV